ncbi:MAG: PilN domain-containing protein [Deltaproteobacteria bacterium]|nr:PilN domain-containing protein [Deltaproteobacteria bacterium]
MIRINLLPFRAARKKENVKRQISIYFLVVLLLLAGMAFYFFRLNSTLSRLKEDEQTVRAQLKTYEDTIKRITELEKRIADIKKKLDVIKALEKNKTGPVHLLDEIAMAVPKDKLWLTSLNENAGQLTLQGTAMDNETVAQFMTNLEKSEYITAVDLQSTRMRDLAKYNLRISDFVLKCKTYAYKEPEPPQKTPKRK